MRELFLRELEGEDWARALSVWDDADRERLSIEAEFEGGGDIDIDGSSSSCDGMVAVPRLGDGLGEGDGERERGLLGVSALKNLFSILLNGIPGNAKKKKIHNLDVPKKRHHDKLVFLKIDHFTWS